MYNKVYPKLAATKFTQVVHKVTVFLGFRGQSKYHHMGPDTIQPGILKVIPDKTTELHFSPFRKCGKVGVFTQLLE